MKNADIANTAKFDPGDNVVVGIERSAARELKFDCLDLKRLLRLVVRGIDGGKSIVRRSMNGG